MDYQITVVTICLNAGYDLDKTVESVANQTYKKFEYLIKDGGSTDGSVERIKKKYPNIHIIIKPDAGIFDAMNQALKIAKFKYINFLNAGDLFYDKHVIQSVNEIIEEDPCVDFIYGNVFFHESRAKHIIYPKSISRYFLFSDSICHQAWFLSRDMQIEIGGYDTGQTLGGDGIMLIEAIGQKGAKSKRINHTIVSYLGGGASTNIEDMNRRKVILDQKKAEVFSGYERILFGIRQNIETIVKKLLYDKYLYRFIRYYRKIKYGHPSSLN